MRVEEEATKHCVEVDWRPFLLGPIFAKQGWTTSPFNVYPGKGRYMVRDIERLAQARGLAFACRRAFPPTACSRRALPSWDAKRMGARLSRAVFDAAFARGEDIASEPVLANALATAGLDAARVLPRGSDPAVKDALKAQTAEAERLGIFGAPSFVTADGELFWGDDRLEHALAWVRGR